MPDWEFDGGDERGDFAESMGEVDDRSLDVVEWEQWEALLAEHVEAGQISPEMVDELRDAWIEWDHGEHEDGFWEVDLDYESEWDY